jgi:hypothetical protein
MYNSNQVWRTVFKVTRWFMLTALLLTVVPMLLLLVLGILILVPKGRTWSSYWGSTLAGGTRAVWHWIFGPPRVRIRRPQFRPPLPRGRWPVHPWRN